MDQGVSYAEAVRILREMADKPDDVRRVRLDCDYANGAVPVFFTLAGVEIEIMFAWRMGVVTAVDSIRVGSAYSNEHDWDRDERGNPWDEMSELAALMIGGAIGEVQESPEGDDDED